jgi:hypothetical protein
VHEREREREREREIKRELEREGEREREREREKEDCFWAAATWHVRAAKIIRAASFFGSSSLEAG